MGTTTHSSVFALQDKKTGIIDIAIRLRATTYASTIEYEKAVELATLLEQWASGMIAMHEHEMKRCKSHYHTPMVLLEWVQNNHKYVPDDLFHHIQQAYIMPSKSGDDKHFYMACAVKKVMDVVASKYGISLKELYGEVGGKDFYTCMAPNKQGKPCSVKVHSGFFCHKHLQHKVSPEADYGVWCKRQKTSNI